MKEVLPFEIEKDTLIYVETVDEAGGFRRVGSSGDAGEKAAGRFVDALAHIRPAADALLGTLRELNTPDEIGLEFGLKFSAKLGNAIFASADSEAAFKVTLKWSNPDRAENGP